MTNLSTSRTAADTVADHVADHNELHTFHNLIDAKGDLIVGTAPDVAGRKAVGADGTVLTADSTAAGGVTWDTPSGGSTIGYLETVLADFPVAFWPLDDTGSPYIDGASVHDATGTGTLATGTNLATGLTRAAVFTSAGSTLLSIDPADGLAPLLIRKQMTVEVLVRVTALPAASCSIVNKASSAGGSNFEYGMSITSTGKVTFTVWTAAGSNIAFVDSGSTLLSTGTTYHLAVSVDTSKSVIRLYINGVDVSSNLTFAGGTYTNGNSAVVIGRRGDGSGQYFDGRMQGVAIFDRALSSKRLLARVPFLV